jgi:hypothetical protein
MSVDTDLKARLESLRINIEWIDDRADDRRGRVITISSFSKRLLEYGAFLISTNAHADPENESVQTTGGGYCLHYRQNPDSPLSQALCGSTPSHDSPIEMKLVLVERRG